MNPIQQIADNELTHQLYLKGKDKAQKEREWTICNESRKVVLNVIAQDIQQKQDCSYAQAEREARISDEYKEHIDKMGEAREAVILARVKYEAIKFEIQERHSKRFDNRAQFNSGKIDT